MQERASRPTFVTVAAVVVLTGCGGSSVERPTRAEAGVPPADLFVSPTGSDSDNCSASKPCRSFARAYDSAALGQVVEVAGGRYVEQVIEGRLAKAPGSPRAPRVLFRPAPGATVELEALEIRVPHLEVRDMRIGQYRAKFRADKPEYASAGDLVFRNIRARYFTLTSTHYVTIAGGEVGPNIDPATGTGAQDGGYVATWPPDQHPPSDIVIDGLWVHDIREPEPEAHSDCIQFTSGRRVTIRNSRFEGCEHADLMIKPDQGPIEGFLIENNVLGETLSGYYSINLGEGSRRCADIVIRHNSALQGVRTDSCQRTRVVGNILPQMTEHKCSTAKAAIDWNLYERGVPCGPSDRVALQGDAGFVDRSRLDLRLRSGSPAMDAGSGQLAPARDARGRRRSAGTAPDLGAFEAG